MHHCNTFLLQVFICFHRPLTQHHLGILCTFLTDVKIKVKGLILLWSHRSQSYCRGDISLHHGGIMTCACGTELKEYIITHVDKSVFFFWWATQADWVFGIRSDVKCRKNVIFLRLWRLGAEQRSWAKSQVSHLSLEAGDVVTKAAPAKTHTVQASSLCVFVGKLKKCHKSL